MDSNYKSEIVIILMWMRIRQWQHDNDDKIWCAIDREQKRNIYHNGILNNNNKTNLIIDINN